MRRMVAVVLGVLVAAVLAQGALARDGKTTLGPAGYSGPGAKRALVVAGTANVVLGSDDHVVICHAIGGPKGTAFIQIAPSAAGVTKGHGDHEADRDVIPPFTLSDTKGSDTSLAAGQNWNAANAALYANGCHTPASTPSDACPNVEGIQTSVPSGMTQDSSGNCVTVVALATPPTIVIEKVVVQTMVVKKVVIKKVKAKKKAVKKAKKVKAKKKIKVKGAQKKFTPRVLPHTR
jgi:hypothetical protein